MCGYVFVSFITEVFMNKKQFLSIAMLISIAGLNASAADLQREASSRVQSMMKNP